MIWEGVGQEKELLLTQLEKKKEHRIVKEKVYLSKPNSLIEPPPH